MRIETFCSVSMKGGLLGPNPTGLLSMSFFIIIYKESIWFIQEKRTAKTAVLNLMISNCTESRTFRQDIWGLYSFYLVKIF